MPAIEQDIMGADAVFEASYRQFTALITDDGTPTGVPIDLTGFHIKWSLALSPIDPPIVTKTSDDVTQIKILDQALGSPTARGQFQLFLRPDDTVALNGMYYHEARATDTAGNPDWVWFGFFQVVPTILKEN